MKDTTTQPPSSGHTIDWQGLRSRLEASQAALKSGAIHTTEQRNAILKARARALAVEPELKEQERDPLETLEFLLAQERYGLDLKFVREVCPLRNLTAAPCTPAFVLGIIHVRGRILSVIDLKKFFGLPEKGLSDLNRVIVLRTEAMEFGILADAILGIRKLDACELGAELTTLSGLRKEFFRGVTPEGTIVLDAEKMLTDQSIIVHEEVAT